MTIPHDRHHAAYVANLNKALVGHAALANKSIEQIVRNLDDAPESIRTAVRNNGGGHLNHSLFWLMMRKGGCEPKGALAKAIDTRFGIFDKFKTAFTYHAIKVVRS